MQGKQTSAQSLKDGATYARPSKKRFEKIKYQQIRQHHILKKYNVIMNYQNIFDDIYLQHTYMYIQAIYRYYELSVDRSFSVELIENHYFETESQNREWLCIQIVFILQN